MEITVKEFCYKEPWFFDESFKEFVKERFPEMEVVYGCRIEDNLVWEPEDLVEPSYMEVKLIVDYNNWIYFPPMDRSETGEELNKRLATQRDRDIKLSEIFGIISYLSMRISQSLVPDFEVQTGINKDKMEIVIEVPIGYGS